MSLNVNEVADTSHAQAKQSAADACPVCQCTSSYTRLTGAGYAIVACTSCRTARTQPAGFVTSAHYGGAPALAQSYLARQATFRRYARRLVRQAQRGCRASGRWLDVGCSVGFLVDEARRAGFDASGIDLDVNAVNIGQSLGHPVALRDLCDLPVEGYEVLTLSHCLEHVPAPLDFLQVCRERLVAGGHLVIVVPCHDSIIARALPGRWYGWQPTQHYFHYSRRGLLLLLEKAGFKALHAHQESMDHRPSWRGLFAAPREFAKGAVLATLAAGGKWLHYGDQLVAIGRR